MPRGRPRKKQPEAVEPEVEAVPGPEAQGPALEPEAGFSLQDPEVPLGAWVAVYRCPEGHKTKATNRQAQTGVVCFACGKAAAILPQFLAQPETKER